MFQTLIMKATVAWFTLPVLLLCSCKKNNHPSPANTQTPSTVYVLGTQAGVMTYWKNDTASSIYSQSGINYSLGSASLYVAAGKGYIAGFEQTNNDNLTGTIPVIWENGVADLLPDSSGNGNANAIFVSGTDVYVAGVTQYQLDTSHIPFTTLSAVYPKAGTLATVWKNGVPTTLPGYSFVGLVDTGKYANRIYEDYVSGIYVSGNNVYVSGGSYFNGYHARYWQNGTPVDLTAGLSYTASNGSYGYPNTTAITVSGNDVYVAGYQTTSQVAPVAIYWKNGTPVFLSTDSISGSSASAIAVSGNDVFVVGWQNIGGYSRAMLWKNGVATTLTSGATASVATSICISGSDVYVAGYQWTLGGYDIAAYWKNGVAVTLSNGNDNAFASAIYVQ